VILWGPSPANIRSQCQAWLIASVISVDQTLAIDLSFSWTNSTVDFVATNKSSAPSINFQALWHDPDENVLYSFGGESTWLPPISGNPPPLSVWKFAPDDRGGGRWSENTTSSDPPFSDGLIRPFGGSTTSSNNTAFYLGGYSSKQSSPKRSSGLDFIPARGIISYSYRNGSWSNDTAAGYSQYATAEWGGVQFVPSLGPEGVLVMFGGDTSTATAYSPGEYLRPMTNITVYEPRSRTWYYQNATGDSLPAARIRMCVVGVQESSNSSYEM